MNFLSYKRQKFATEFSKQCLCQFGIRTRNECPVIFNLATHNLLDCCTTYLHEAAFSKLKIIKYKNRPFMKNAENVLRLTLSCINLRMDDLCKNQKVVPLH